MAETLGQAVIEIGADTSSLGKEIKDGLGDASRSTAAPAKSLGSKFSGLVGKVAKRGLQTAGVAGGLAFGTALAKGMGRLNAIEQAEAKLGALGHTAEGVEKIMDNALASVEGTAYGLGDAASVAAGVVAAGVKPGKELEGVLKTVANSAALAGMEMGEMGAIFNKAAASGKVQGDIINQLGDRGIPILQFLADELGVTAGEVSKLAAEGKVDFKTFERAMKEGVGDAATAMGGTVSGAIANTQAALGRLGASALRGAFSKVPSALGKVQSALDDLGPVAEKAGAAIGDGFTAAGKVIAKYGPTIRKIIQDLAQRIMDLGKAWAPVLADIGRGVADLSVTLGKVLVPAMGLTLEVLTKLGELLDLIPDPLKQMGVQAAIAALVLPRLTAGFAAATAAIGSKITMLKVLKLEMQDATMRSRNLSTAMTKFGGVAKTAAGIGGMLALTESTKQSNKWMGTLMSTAGGAATGFAVGGPWGAAVGGAAGLLGGLWSATKKSNEEMGNTKPALDYAASLDEVSGAATRATREIAKQALQESGAFESAKQLGITRRDLIGALLEEEGALKRVGDAMKANGTIAAEEAGSFDAQVRINAIENLNSALGAGTEEFRKQRKEVRDNIVDMQDLSGLADKIPENVFMHVDAKGIRPTEKGIARVTRRFDNLNGKQIKAIIEAVGVDTTVKDVKKTEDRLNAVSKAKADLRGWVKGIDTATKKGARYSEEEVGEIVTKLNSIEKAHPKMGPYIDTVRTGVFKARGEADKSTEVGAQLKNGLLNGMYGTGTALSSIMSGAVRQAIAAARREAQVKSPSRETMEIGRFMGLGFVIGMQQQTPAVQRSATRLANVALSSISRVTRQAAKGGKNKRVRKALQNFLIGDNNVTKEMRKVLGKRLTKQLRKLDRQVSREYAKLEKRIQRRNDYAQEVRTANAFNLSELNQADEYGFTQMTFANISSSVRAHANKARQFAGLIRKMAKAGIPKGLIQQVIGMGIVEGSAAATALLSASKAEIKSLASDWRTMESNVKNVGNLAANTMYQAGVKAQEGLVKGLLKDSTLNKAARKLSKKLTKKIRKALGIKSPSVLMEREVGTDLGLGIGIGAIKGLDKIQDQVNEAVAGLIDPVQVAPVSFADPVRGLSPVTAPAPASPASLRATLDPSGANLSIDYEALAEAMSRVQQRLVINNRQAGLLVQTGLTTIEGQA